MIIHMDELLAMTATQLSHEIRERRLSIEELMRSYLEQIEEYDGAEGLNAIAELDEKALKNARRMDEAKSAHDKAMYGLPILLKDNIDVEGLHTTAGSYALSDNVAACDASVVANLRRNGALIFGKTNMTEFANYTSDNMPGGYSSRGGQVRNAYNREKSPSGSSSGSAVAMSAGFCAAAVGTDTSFSIIECAAENGVTGLKPSHGSLSSQGIVPIARTLDSAGPITRDLTDALLVYSCMRKQPLPSVEPMNPKDIRLAVNVFNREEVSQEQLAKYDVILDALKSDGAHVMEVIHRYSPCQRDVMRCEFRHDLENYLAGSAAKRRMLKEIISFYETNPERMMKYGDSFLRGALDDASGKLDDEAYVAAMCERERLRIQLLENLNSFDACLMTGPTNIMHFTGLPSLSLRLGTGNDGMPRGMILYGADEQHLFSAALTLEKYCKPVPKPKL